MHMLSRDMIDCGSPTSKTSKTYQRSGTTNWGPRQCRLIRMLNVRGTWVGKMALFGGSQYAPMILGMSLRLLRPLIGMAAPTVLRFLWHTEGLLFFFRGWNKSILYIQYTWCIVWIRYILQYVWPCLKSFGRISLILWVPHLNRQQINGGWAFLRRFLRWMLPRSMMNGCARLGVSKSGSGGIMGNSLEIVVDDKNLQKSIMV